MKKNNKTLPKKIKTKGLVIPNDWDTSGRVTSVLISTHDEENYTVELNQKGRVLLSFIRKPVKVAGILRKSNGDMVIDIENYNIINLNL